MSAPIEHRSDSPDQRQRRAADPDRSVWLEANAGSGKTRVLIDRVSRLLFDGVDPGHILCVTYTKAAANEMQNRLFDRLSKWAMATDRDLKTELGGLGIQRALTDRDLAEARRLFAQAVEVPGGLKIQTFHAFAASVLRRFPREAGVAPDFTALDEYGARNLMGEVLDAMANDPADRAVLEHFAEVTGHEDMEQIANEVVSKTPPDLVWPTKRAIFDSYGADESWNHPAFLAQILAGDAPNLARITPVLIAGPTKKDRLFGEFLNNLNNLDALSAIKGFEKHCLVKKNMTAKIGGLPSVDLRDGALAAELGWFNAFLQRVEDVHPMRIALQAATCSAALLAFAERFLTRYKRAKTARGAVDFGDQIALLSSLLTTPGLKDYVLWRLDGQIEHILVDEAQDTAAAPWEALQALTAEFTAGMGAHNRPRKLFVVGDPKQSIYRFQGADAARFDAERRGFQSRMKAAGDPLREVSLAHSFRSSPAILTAVDAVFARLGWQNCTHLPFWQRMPGRVDLWPALIGSKQKDEKPKWWEPVDARGEAHPTRVLAQTIADRIRVMLDGETLPCRRADTDEFDHRPIKAGDIMILVQRRSTMFAEVLHACKKAGLPVAGADRLQVGAELAVRDLMALCHAVATPADDLSLAAVLRSPLLGWSEQALFDLAARRPEGMHLNAALRQRDDAQSREALALLDDLSSRSEFMRPFDLLERVLIRHDGRARLLGRLGMEAADGIDALLAEAMAYEREHVPSLTGFLAWAEAEDREIKRQFSDKEDLIRIMSVHGAKGLERPIVILPDTLRGTSPMRDSVLRGNDVRPLAWRSPKGEVSPHDQQFIDRDKEAEAAERKRLLYVAMTRAESWLIVAGAGGSNSNTEMDWYGDVSRGLDDLDCEPLTIEGLAGEGRRHSFGTWQSGAYQAAPKPDSVEAALPTEWQAPPRPLLEPVQRNASELGGAKALPSDAGEPEDIALARGTAIHRLLDRLVGTPVAEQVKTAQAMLSGDLAEDLIAPVIDEALAVLNDPAHASLFGNDVLSEVPLSADWVVADGSRLNGVIDKLIIGEDQITIVDFKTNRAVPFDTAQIPEGIVRQMAAYAAAAGQIWPGRAIRCDILWTATRQRMTLPDAQITAALVGIL